MNGVSEDAIGLCLFPFSLKRKVKSWLNQGQARPQQLLGFQNRGPPLPLPYEAASQNHPLPTKANLEVLKVKFMSATDNRMTTIEAAQRNQETSIQSLEKQIQQLVKLYVNAISVKVDEESFTEREVMIIQERDCSE
ncbi:hypothetical protein M9H77_35660 [Catharanthus roseus]|uniref:Uncharacterized protein n=1 Tax=Catharanthus roseus TaxID=4058 RepID=A0ACB9ZPX4_CATRO|nr:hypothetical protein M9H77_35660 [Catharanthus roseus]